VTSTNETRAEAWQRRAGLRGDIDFTMMYVGHDAFCRDLDRLIEAAATGQVLTAEARGTWTLFSEMLHTHHGAEDVALWPPLRAAVTAAEDVAILDAMEREHAAIDPSLDAITAAFAQNRADDVAHGLEELSAGLRAHMLHEENEALPLLERTLGLEAWAAFGVEARKQTGMRGAARMLPWVLDEAPPDAAQRVLGMMPAPLRVAYKHLWAPAHRRSTLLREQA